jgi:hypothetical protein
MLARQFLHLAENFGAPTRIATLTLTKFHFSSLCYSPVLRHIRDPGFAFKAKTGRRTASRSAARLMAGLGIRALRALIDAPQNKTTLVGQIVLPKFALERRAGVSFDQERYFATAPMSTVDHLAVLEEIERVAAEAESDE